MKVGSGSSLDRLTVAIERRTVENEQRHVVREGRGETKGER